MMRSKVDLVVGLLITFVLLVGLTITIQTYQAATDGMGHGWAMHGVHPIWNLLGALLVAVVIAGTYALAREQLHASMAVEDHDQTRAAGATSETPDEAGEAVSTEAGRTAPSERSADEILRYLPEDERRILTPVIESPGLTQIELRDRADFSKSKVSQSVSALEKRGLLYREPQGRTYRVYPSETLQPESAK